jgi:hypothetical protein
MAKSLRLAFAVFLVGALFSVCVNWFGFGSSGGSDNGVSAQTTPSTSAPQKPATQPVTVDPRPTILRFLGAVELGDTDVVLELTGSKQGKRIVGWCAKDLTAFVGHTDFWPFTKEGGLPTSKSALPSNASGDVNGANWAKWMIKTYDNGTKACVHVDSFMRFLDPGALPSTRNVCHFYIDGEFKLEASGGEWIITSLPNYQEARNDGPGTWGSNPYNYPYPGDALGPYNYSPWYEPAR